MKVHEGETGDVHSEGPYAEVVEIELEVERVGHGHIIERPLRYIRQRVKDAEPLASGTQRVEGEKGGVAYPDEPRRRIIHMSTYGKVEVPGNLSQRPRENHELEGERGANLRN